MQAAVCGHIAERHAAHASRRSEEEAQQGGPSLTSYTRHGAATKHGVRAAGV